MRKPDNKNKTMKAQGSTEYLVVLVVVLVIAVIAIALLGGYSPFGTAGSVEQSQAYWQGATPFSVEDAQIVTQNSSG